MIKTFYRKTIGNIRKYWAYTPNGLVTATGIHFDNGDAILKGDKCFFGMGLLDD